MEEDKTAFITGINGQDGSLLAELLLSKEYEVYGMARRTSSPTDWRLHELGLYHNKKFHIVSGDLTDYESIRNCLSQCSPHEVYNLGAQSYVGASWSIPLSTHDITGMGAVRIYEASRAQEESQGYTIKIYQASSSEMFGGECKTNLMNEKEPLYPRSPYGAAKCLAHLQAGVNRDSYDQFISCGILFNHESEFRGIQFVTRKVTDAVAKIYLGKQDKVTLGCLDSVRDWGYAGDYIEAMWRMLQEDSPEDFVIATGKTNSIRDLCKVAFKQINIEDWKNYVDISDSNIRPADIKHLMGDSNKAQEKLGWSPKVSFEQMIVKMVHADIRRLEEGGDNEINKGNSLHF